MKVRNAKVMRIHEKCKRLLALLLVSVMVLQQGTITTFAESAESANQQEDTSDFMGGADDSNEVTLEEEGQNDSLGTTDLETNDDEENIETNSEDGEASQDVSLASLEDELNIQPVDVGSSSDSIDLKNAVSNVVIAKVNGEQYDPNKTYPRGSTIEFSLSYNFPEDNKPSADGIKVSTYTIPSGLKVADKTGTIDGGTYTAGAGTYKIENNIVTFTYTEGFLEVHPDYISGTFSFSGTLDGSITDNKDNATIEFPGNGTTFPITINFESGKISGSKSYVLNSDGTIDFTINLNVSDRDVTDVKLTDTQGSNLQFADDSQFKLDGVVIADATTSGSTATLNLGSLAIGNHVITYKAKLVDKSKTDAASNQNQADWTWTGGQGSAKTQVAPVNKLLKKTGTVQKNQDGEYVITWTAIYIPGTFGTVAGKTFTDTLGEGQKYTGSYEVYYDPSGTQWNVAGSKIADGTITEGVSSFTYTFDEKQTASQGGYKIVYQTKVTKDFEGKETFTNKIENTDGDNTTGSVDINNTIPAPDIVSKSGVADQENRQATWTVTVKADGKTVKDLEVTDTLQDNYNWKGKYLDDVTVSETIDGNVSSLTKDIDYTVVIDNSAGTMVVIFKKDITGTVTITYKTDYSSSEKTGWANNQISSKYNMSDKDYTENDSTGVEFKDYNFSLDKTGNISGGVASWKVVVNDGATWQRASLPESAKTIVDTIPEGMTYVDNSLQCTVQSDYYDKTVTANWNEATVSYDQNTNKLNIALNNIDLTKDSKIRIELSYQTKLTNTSNSQQSSEGMTFTNRVAVGGKTDTATVEIVNKELDKKGVQVTDKNVVEYTIGVNYASEDLNPGKDTLTLTDELDSNLVLDTHSISVKDMNTGNAVNYTASFGTSESGGNVLTLTVPNKKALTVTYRAALNTAGRVDGQTYSVSNNATLKGESQTSSEISTNVIKMKDDATIVGTTNSINIQKVDSNGNGLSGAKFVVQEVNPVTLESKDDGQRSEQSTDSSGSTKFEDLSLNTLYYYQEIQAPSGYKIKDADKHYFFIKNTTGEENQNKYNTLKLNIKAGTQYAELSGGQTFIIENERIETGSLVITKTINGDVTDAEAEGALKFTVTAPSGDVTNYTLKDFTKGEDEKYTLTLDKVAAGKYNVEETTYDITGNAVTVKYSVNGGDATEGSKTDVEVSKNGTSTVAFEDVYTKKSEKTGSHTSDSTPASTSQNSVSNRTATVQTGDEASVKEYMGLLLAGIAMVFFGYSGRRRKKH